MNFLTSVATVNITQKIISPFQSNDREDFTDERPNIVLKKIVIEVASIIPVIAGRKDFNAA